ncbi:MAG: TIGR02452 family protein [Pirellulaceae bacterium]
MANRKRRAEIANETVELLQRESYTLDGTEISLSAMLKSMRDGTVLYTPNDLAALGQSLTPPDSRNTRIEVRNCTTFAAAKSLVDDGYPNPLCLNFASAKNPGGGFLSGSQAQEECLARASGLFQSLNREMAYYNINRSYDSSLYTNHIIYSPSVPVFRNEDDALISPPYTVSIVTSPAVNAGAVRKNEPERVSQIRPTMEERIRSVLAVGRQNGHEAIVLGAWGCGVFGNDPSDVAQWFADALQSDSNFVGAFDRVVFAVLDYADGTPSFNAFREIFADNRT